MSRAAGSLSHHLGMCESLSRRPGSAHSQPESATERSWLELRTVFWGLSLPGCVLGLDLRLELEQAVEHVLRSRWTTGDVNIHRHDRVDSHDGRVVVVEAAGAGADTKRDDPFGLGHLLVDALQDR